MARTGSDRIPATMALLRFFSQRCPCVSGKIAIESSKRAKKDIDQNGRILPRCSISLLFCYEGRLLIISILLYEPDFCDLHQKQVNSDYGEKRQKIRERRRNKTKVRG